VKLEKIMNKLPDINQDFAAWYQEVVYQAELADQAPVRGCMVIRPYGTALWELIKSRLDERIKATGHHNAMFPLLIPQSFLAKEAEHVEGFAPELAVVTHAGGKELEEPLVIRPTSETIIHYMFAKWLRSWRDLPIKINQWANVMRWEMRTRPFLRTSEFYWQEGHTAHETEVEAQAETLMMLEEYVDLATNYLAIPVVKGQKSEHEKFPGADVTYTFEGLMPDGKALQMGTSHRISQNFAKAFNMMYQDRQGGMAYPYLTSWGATTRLIGALVMTHGDAKGLIMPPKVAPIQIVIIPILKKGADTQHLLSVVDSLAATLRTQWRVEIDARDYETPGAKFFTWELKGVPLRLEIGPRDLEQHMVVLVERLNGTKKTVPFDALTYEVDEAMIRLHEQLLARATQRRDSMWYKKATLAEFSESLKDKGGFYQTGWCRDKSCELSLKEYSATIRCLIPEAEFSSCFKCGKASAGDVLIARAY
jgi:prolyl-tRNA synthetase